ncbi:PspC domain-containing protein [Altererythrobacter sp. H2]|nr:PspC domain-containing protein [Altererythrobacter sp. H2]WRK97218.1 PspC domain-containing protein [Altererythrobacter sp. H2]
MTGLQERPAVSVPSKSFRLDKAQGKLWGVCGGIANYFGIDPMLVRIGFVAGTVIGFGSLILVYLAIALIAD